MRSRYIAWTVVLMLAISTALMAQQGNTVTIHFSGAPTGTCAPVMQGIDDATGAFYICWSGAWNAVSGGGGAVSSVFGRTGAVVAQYGDYSYDQIAGAPPAPSSAGNYLSSGGGVYYTGTAYDYIVSAASYYIAGTAYSSAQTSVNLSASDPTFNRFDTIYVDTAGTVNVITGTAAANPIIPQVTDPSTQLALTSIEVFAGTTTPTGSSTENIYLDNAEWTCTSSASINCASTNNPYSGTLDIEATSSPKTDYVNLAKGSSLSPETYTNLTFFIRSKATWSTQRSLSISWYLSGSPVGTPVTFKDGTYAFSSSNTTSYQLIVIPVSSFQLAGSSVDSIRMTVAGGGSATIGFYLDNIVLQNSSGSGGGSTGSSAFLYTINNQTGTSYTVGTSDTPNPYIRMNNASANTVTIPPNATAPFPIGTTIVVMQVGAGQTTVAAGSGVTINTPTSLSTRAQWSTIAVTKVDTNTWDAAGDLQ